jgi:hypothetical protein
MAFHRDSSLCRSTSMTMTEVESVLREPARPCLQTIPQTARAGPIRTADYTLRNPATSQSSGDGLSGGVSGSTNAPDWSAVITPAGRPYRHNSPCGRGMCSLIGVVQEENQLAIARRGLEYGNRLTATNMAILSTNNNRFRFAIATVFIDRPPGCLLTVKNGRILLPGRRKRKRNVLSTVQFLAASRQFPKRGERLAGGTATFSRREPSE